MDPTVKPHRHNGSDSNQLNMSEAISGLPLATISTIGGSASGTYDAATQTLINTLVSTVNQLTARLRSAGIIV